MSIPAVVAVALLLPTLSAALLPLRKCDLYKGKWVVDDELNARPLYSSGNCPFITPPHNCIPNGRPDLQYQTYTWQPNNCLLPRWNGREFARKMRGKRIMFVGDSIGMNQWQSLACMIFTAHTNLTYQYIGAGLLNTILFPELNITLMYLQNRLFVDIEIENGKRVLKLDSIAVGSREWLGNDVLIFDTWHWFHYEGEGKLWDLVREGNATVSDVDRVMIYEKALKTWARWIDQNMDTAKVKLFFQGVSPDHWNASTWGKPELQRCKGEQRPLERPVEENTFANGNNILKRVIESMNKPVHLLDITESSQYRVDGHPSIYANLARDIDCVHWCLPGVPDTWNQFLYAALSFTLF